MKSASDDEQLHTELLESEKKAWIQLDADVKLNLKDLIFRLENAPKTQSSPGVAEDMKDVEKWLSEVNTFRESLVERYANAVNRVNVGNQLWEAASLAVDAESCFKSKEMAVQGFTQDTTTKKRVRLTDVVRGANDVSVPEEIKEKESLFA